MTEDTLVQINFKIDPAVKVELERRAREEHRSMSGHILHLIERDIRAAATKATSPSTTPEAITQ